MFQMGCESKLKPELNCDANTATQQEIVGYLEIDHIVPESLGGGTMPDNLCLACTCCNRFKSNFLTGAAPASGEERPLFDPRRHALRQHFDWNEDGTQVVGLTATGRATIMRLQMDRSNIVATRRLWASVGWHPPRD
jgi:hypothetical protein